MKKPTDIIHLQVRLPEALRRKLAKQAEANGRSLNAEIVWMLEQVLELAVEGLNARAKRMDEEIKELRQQMDEVLQQFTEGKKR